MPAVARLTGPATFRGHDSRCTALPCRVNVSSSTEVAVRVRGEVHAVYAWWRDPRRLDEMRSQWESFRNFRWQQSRDGDRAEIRTGWISPSGIDVSLHMTLHEEAFPYGRNEMSQLRRHPGGRQDRSASSTRLEFRGIRPGVTEVRVVTRREQEGWAWWHAWPPGRVRRHTRRHLAAQARRCESELADLPPPADGADRQTEGF